jgi:hypothetical protein
VPREPAPVVGRRPPRHVADGRRPTARAAGSSLLTASRVILCVRAVTMLAN